MFVALSCVSLSGFFSPFFFFFLTSMIRCDFLAAGVDLVLGSVVVVGGRAVDR